MPVYKRIRNNKPVYFARINYTNDKGEHKTKSSKYFKTKSEAKIEEARLSMIMTEQGKGGSYTFAQIYYEFYEFQKGKVRESTLNNYIDLFSKIEPLHDIKIDKLTISQYTRFKEAIDSEPLKTSTKNMIHKFVKQLINFSYTMHNVGSSVPQKVGGFKEPGALKQEMQFFTKSEFDKFISYFDNDLIYRALYETLFYLGLRVGEAQALRWCSLKGNELNINANVSLLPHGKGYVLTQPKTASSNRVLPLNNILIEEYQALRNYFSKMDSFNENWFIFGGIKPLSKSSIANHKNKACEELGLKQIRIHDFRHSCASYYINKGATPMLVAKLLGHSNIAMTLNTYSHLWPNELDKLINL